MSENTAIKTTSWISEAPASWNTRYVTLDGFVCQLTLRGENGRDLLEKANAALAFLRENGYRPFESFSSHSRSNGAVSDENAAAKTNGNGSSTPPAVVCPIHQCEMKRWEKDGKVWFSHKVDGKWCTGK